MSYPKSPNENWVRDETLDFLRNRDKKRLKKLKSERKGKRFRLVKISDCPETWIEKEIKD
jgi:hypothetical protein